MLATLIRPDGSVENVIECEDPAAIYAPGTWRAHVASDSPEPPLPTDLAALKDDAKKAVRREEQRRLVDIIGDGDAADRLLLRYATINRMRSTDYPVPAVLPAPWKNRETKMIADLAAVDALNVASGLIDADLDGLPDVAAVLAWLVTMPTDVRWPL